MAESTNERVDFGFQNANEGSVLATDDLAVNPALEDATLILQLAPGMSVPYEYGGVESETAAYRSTASICTNLMISPIYDVIGSDAAALLEMCCINRFSNMGERSIRHAVLCNDEGQILTDGVVIRLAEDRFRTYWLNPPLQYYVESSLLDVKGENMSGKEYFIQVAGEKSLEILENAFCQDLHDIEFATHRSIEADGRTIEVIRLGMTGGLAYEIHGPIEDYAKVYRMVWASGKRFGAVKMGMHAYNMFCHTEGGFPNIGQHYPLPWFESGEDLALWLRKRPALANMNINRMLKGSVGKELGIRFMTPFDVGWDFLVNFDHDFRGKEALQRLAANPPRQAVTLEWNADDVGAAYAALLTPGNLPLDDISKQADMPFMENSFNGYVTYRADWVLSGESRVGISAGRIISYNYRSMISLGFIDPAYAEEGTELAILWGTPGTAQMRVRVTVRGVPYNADIVRNGEVDTKGIPRLG